MKEREMSDTMDRDQTPGIEDGMIVIDSYSGEAMDPRFYRAWRGFNQACDALSETLGVLDREGVAWDAPTASDLADDAPFIWRALSPEEQAWSEAAYARVQPWT